MSTSNKELKGMLDELSETLLVLVYGKYEVMPKNAKPDAIWTMLAELSNGIIGTCRRLTRMSDHLSSDTVLEAISNDADGEAEAPGAQNIIQGVQRFNRTCRAAVFDDESRCLPPPRKETDPNGAGQILHEMIFDDSDCFLELSCIQPGSHGWIIIFRDELKDWLLSAVEPFHVLYQDRQGKRTYFGIYAARMLARASMNGAEFACLSATVLETIVTALSQSERGSKVYNARKGDLLLSLKTLPCILLQCIEFIPVMYNNSLADVTKLVQPVPTRLPLPLPRQPRLPYPTKRNSWQDLSNLQNQIHIGISRESSQVSQDHQYQSIQSSSSLARGTTTMVTNGGGSVSFSSHDDRRDNFDKIPKKASLGRQTWQEDTDLVNSDRPGMGPQPLQLSVRCNHQPNLQPNFGSHRSMVPNHQNLPLFSQAQSHSATYWTPRGYQDRNINQNINPIRNPHLSTGLPTEGLCPPSRSLYLPASVSSQYVPLPQYGTASLRSRSHHTRRMQ